MSILEIGKIWIAKKDYGIWQDTIIFFDGFPNNRMLYQGRELAIQFRLKLVFGEKKQQNTTVDGQYVAFG